MFPAPASPVPGFTEMSSTLPFFKARGSWGQIGLSLGRQLEPLIRQHLDAWLAHVVAQTGCTREDAIACAGVFAEPIEAHAPFLWEELDGLARGCGLSVDSLLVLQARSEVQRLQTPAAKVESECTTFAIGPSRTEHRRTYFGHNIDLPAVLEPYGVVLQHEPDDGPATLMYTGAGLLGHNGLNELGVGICANFIEDPAGWGIGFPRYLLSRLALCSETTDAAVRAVTAPPRAASRNLLIADASGDMIDLELLVGVLGELQPDDDLLMHTNHLEAVRLKGLDTPERDSLVRRSRVETLFESADGPVTLEVLKSFVRDHENGIDSICVHDHATSFWKTIVSVIGDLSTRSLHVAKGNPCGSEFVSYGFC